MKVPCGFIPGVQHRIFALFNQNTYFMLVVFYISCIWGFMIMMINKKICYLSSVCYIFSRRMSNVSLIVPICLFPQKSIFYWLSCRSVLRLEFLLNFSSLKEILSNTGTLAYHFVMWFTHWQVLLMTLINLESTVLKEQIRFPFISQ